MISFFLRLAFKAVVVQRIRFLSLTLTISAASLLLIILSALYLNNENQMTVKLSGVPNMVIETKENSHDVNTIQDTEKLTDKDIRAIKSPDYFWHANIVTLAPVMLGSAIANGKPVKLAGTWFSRDFRAGNQLYRFGMFTFGGWNYIRGDSCPFCSVSRQSDLQNSFLIAGANLQLSDPVLISVNGTTKAFHIAGRISTGSYWDDYIFLDSKAFSALTGENGFDEILVSAMLKPDDKLSVQADQFGINTLSSSDMEKYMCSAYPGVILQTMQEALPKAKIKILRAITEVQAGIITTSRSIFLALFILTLIASLTAIFSAEKMYAASHIKDFGIMSALGAAHTRIIAQLFTEISISSTAAGIIAFLASYALVPFISEAVYGIIFPLSFDFILGVVLSPFIVSSTALIFLKSKFKQNVAELLRTA